MGKKGLLWQYDIIIKRTNKEDLSMKNNLLYILQQL